VDLAAVSTFLTLCSIRSHSIVQLYQKLMNLMNHNQREEYQELLEQLHIYAWECYFLDFIF
jgi:hypothetical protein